MADVVDVATRSKMMAGIRGKDTKPEIFLRKALHRLGFRYRLGGRGLLGKPDIVFPALNTVIFVHGCFWHCHHCKYFKWPSTNQLFWENKLTANAARDKRTKKELEKLGWHVLIVWECELRQTGFKLPNPVVSRVAKQLRARAEAY